MKRLKRIGLFILIIIVSILIIYPIYWMFMSSLMPVGTSVIEIPIFFPSKLTIEPYLGIFGSTTKPIGRWLINTAIIAFSSTFFTIIVSSTAAYGIARFKFKGKKIYTFIILLAQMLPPTILIIPLFIFFKKLGLTNSLIGVVISYITFTLPLCTWVLWGFFKRIPVELEEAAMIDGCTQFGAFLRILIPLATPGLAAVSLLSFLEGWGAYLYAFVLTSSVDKWTISLGLSSFIGEHNTSTEFMMATAVIATIPPILIFIWLERYLVSGLTLGAING